MKKAKKKTREVLWVFEEHKKNPFGSLLIKDTDLKNISPLCAIVEKHLEKAINSIDDILSKETYLKKQVEKTKKRIIKKAVTYGSGNSR